MPESFRFRAALGGLLSELLEGPRDAAYFLNRGDRGLLHSHERLSATEASARPDGRASVAAHVDHVRYGLSLLNRWARGEDPWHDADFSASWKRVSVSEAEWTALRTSLASEARSWAAAVDQRAAWDGDSMSEAMGSVVHLGYHFGAIRQMAARTAGPRAQD